MTDNAKKTPSEAETKIGWIRDARGRRVSQLDPVLLHMLRRHDSIPAEPLRTIATEIGSGLTKQTRGLAIAATICLGLVLIALTVESATRWTAGEDLYSVLWRALRASPKFIGVFTGPFLFYIIALKRRSSKTTKVLLTHLRCPHCGYDLRGLPVRPAEDVTICPECGCAWVLPDTPGTPAQASSDDQTP